MMDTDSDHEGHEEYSSGDLHYNSSDIDLDDTGQISVVSSMDASSSTDSSIIASTETSTSDESSLDITGHRSEENKISRRANAFSREAIKSALETSCGCSRQCMQLIKYDDVVIWRRKYHLLPMGSRQQMKLMELYKQTIFSEESGNTLHFVEGTLLCRKGFLNLLGISQSTYTRCKRLVTSGITSVVPTTFGKNTSGQKGQIALGFMKHYVSIVGDHHPESGRILLPLGVNVKDIYTKYCFQYENALTKPAFYKIWKKKLPHVSKQKYASRVAMCRVCFLAREVLQRNLSPDEEKAVINDRDEHLQRQRAERESYYGRRAAAISDPDKISIILDGMDQSKTNIPHFSGWVVPKDCDAANLLQTHIVGGEVHGRKVHVLIDLLQWPHDSNLTTSCLLYILKHATINNKLPSTIYVQLDNCGRENKNKYFLGLMAWLVKMGYTENIILSFLMVGHTHEDIDARFSRISLQLKNKHAKTLPDLLDIIEASIEGKMDAQLLPCVFGIKQWLEPFLESIHNHSYPHVYNIFKDEANHARIRYKNWSTDEDWQPSPSEQQLEIFKLDELGRQRLPYGIPEKLVPNLDDHQNMTALRANIERMNKYMTSEENEWWQHFLSNPLSYVCEETTPWYLDGLETHCQYQEITTNEHSDSQTDDSDRFTSPLGIVMRKERSIPKVYTGRNKKHAEPSNQTPDAIRNGCMVVIIEDGDIYIGKLKTKTGDVLQVTLFCGSINEVWIPAVNGLNEEMVKNVDINLIKENHIFQLTKAGKLPNDIKSILKNFQ